MPPWNTKKAERLEYDLLMTDEQRAEKRRKEEEAMAQAKRRREDAEYHLYQVREAISEFLSSDTFKMLAFYGAIAIVVIGLIVGGIALVRKFQEQKSWKGTISELHYRREKYIEEYQAVGGGDWWDQQPVLSYNNYYTGDKVRSYHTESYTSLCTRTKTSTDSKGNMTTSIETYVCLKTKEVPDYDRWYEYTINRWGLVRTVFTEERQSKTELTLSAVWPTPDGIRREFGTKDCSTQQMGTSELKIISNAETTQVKQATDPMLGCQRIAVNQGEWYYITYHYELNGKPFNQECSIDYGTWQSLRVGKEAWGMYYTYNESFNCNDGHIGVQPTATPKES